MKRFLGGRSFKYGSNAFISVAVVLGIVVIFNYLFNKYHHRYDVTPGKLYSLSDQTVTVLKNLNKEVKITAFYREVDDGRFRDLMREYAYRSDKISYEFIDPDKNPAIAKRYGIRAYRTTVLESEGREEKIEGSTEKDITNAVIKVTRERNKVIYFTQGHGEVDLDATTSRDGYSEVQNRLKDSNYDVEKIVLAQEGKIPEDCAALVVAGPKTAFFPTEIGLISTYLDKGGSAFFLLDPNTKSGLEDMLRSWSIEVGDDFVVDFGIVAQLFGVRDRTMPVTTQYGSHPITEKHKGLMTAYPLARSVSLSGKKEEGTTGTELVKTTAQSWAERDVVALDSPGAKISRDPDDKPGPISLAVAVTSEARIPEEEAEEGKERKSRLVVFGDSEFANNQFFYQQGNGDLFLNSINWLVEEEEMISIRPKGPRFNPISLTARDGKVIFWFSAVLMPVAVLIAGVAVWWRRR